MERAQQSQKPGLNLNPSTLDDIVCGCASNLWIPLYQVKLVPGILVGQIQDGAVPMESGHMACAKCGKPLDEAINRVRAEREEKNKLII